MEGKKKTHLHTVLQAVTNRELTGDYFKQLRVPWCTGTSQHLCTVALSAARRVQDIRPIYCKTKIASAFIEMRGFLSLEWTVAPISLNSL